MSDPQRDEYDWIETVARLGKAVGMNPVRIRWKLRAWQDRQKGRGAAVKSKARAVRREHKTCPVCNGINAIDDKSCTHCGARLRSRQGELVARFFRQFGFGLGVEVLLVVGFAICYVLVATAGEQSSLFSLSSQDLVLAGGNYHDPAPGWPAGMLPWQARRTLDLQYWRLWSYAFLHAGPMHIGFNSYALLYIAPMVRQIYGTNKALLVYLVTGVAAGAASLLWAMTAGKVMVSIGASGAICGFVGLMLVWGHQDRTHIGIRIRNGMARWVLYIVIFGFVVGADHAAHIGGVVAGGLMALLLPTSIARGDSTPWRLAGGLASLACLGAVILVAVMSSTL